MIPNVSVTPTLDEIQEVLVLAGKNISGLSKGVAQWSGGKQPRVTWIDLVFLIYINFVLLRLLCNGPYSRLNYS